MKKAIVLTAVVTFIICTLAGALVFVLVGESSADTEQVRQWKATIHQYGTYKEEQQLELDILKIQREIAVLKGPARQAASAAVTPQQLGGEFVPMDKLPPEVQKRALTDK